VDGTALGTADGPPLGNADGIIDGSAEGRADGRADGITEGTVLGAVLGGAQSDIRQGQKRWEGGYMYFASQIPSRFATVVGKLQYVCSKFPSAWWLLYVNAAGT
jgi:hypothetical protein